MYIYVYIIYISYLYYIIPIHERPHLVSFIGHIYVHDLVIGISNTTPCSPTPKLPSSYSNCTYHQGRLPVRSTISLYCDAYTLSGRHLFLQMQDPQEYLALMEVEVYALQSGKYIFVEIV